ncbi:MAG: hypothetical protein LUC93_16475 [Planctomycetaceae bacterium]|nr:hypothetical protein [Planctomycetaceae bacterium]
MSPQQIRSEFSKIIATTAVNNQNSDYYKEVEARDAERIVHNFTTLHSSFNRLLNTNKTKSQEILTLIGEGFDRLFEILEHSSPLKPSMVDGLLQILNLLCSYYSTKNPQNLPFNVMYQVDSLNRRINFLQKSINSAQDEASDKIKELDNVLISTKDKSEEILRLAEVTAEKAGVAKVSQYFAIQADNCIDRRWFWAALTVVFLLLFILFGVFYFISPVGANEKIENKRRDFRPLSNLITNSTPPSNIIESTDFNGLVGVPSSTSNNDANLKESHIFYQSIAARFAVLACLLSATLWCAKIYKALYHQEICNRHRALTVQTMGAFISSVNDPTVKDAVILETTKAAFAHVHSGFISDKGGDHEVNFNGLWPSK